MFGPSEIASLQISNTAKNYSLHHREKPWNLIEVSSIFPLVQTHWDPQSVWQQGSIPVHGWSGHSAKFGDELLDREHGTLLSMLLPREDSFLAELQQKPSYPLIAKEKKSTRSCCRFFTTAAVPLLDTEFIPMVCREIANLELQGPLYSFLR